LHDAIERLLHTSDTHSSSWGVDGHYANET
jgi:hypothetical protein